MGLSLNETHMCHVAMQRNGLSGAHTQPWLCQRAQKGESWIITSRGPFVDNLCDNFNRRGKKEISECEKRLKVVLSKELIRKRCEIINSAQHATLVSHPNEHPQIGLKNVREIRRLTYR